MTTQTTPADGESVHHGQSTEQTEIDKAVREFIRVYDARCHFFEDSFFNKIAQGNRKALSELQCHPLPPTQMDLRKEFAACVNKNVPDNHHFRMRNGKAFTMKELKHLVPEWSSIAEKALIASDPALADKLMTLTQWNAKSAFEVTFMNAINELKGIKISKQAPATVDHYVKWTINPLKKAIEEVKSANTPGNALVGYGSRIPLSEALKVAENLENDFDKALKRWH